jgi:hypothetical protein
MNTDDHTASKPDSNAEGVSFEELNRRMAMQFRAMPAKTCGLSSALSFDPKFLLENGSLVARTLERYLGGTMEIVGFTPSWRTTIGQGMFALEFRSPHKDVNEYCLLIEFCAPAPSRRGFDVSCASDQGDAGVFNDSFRVDNWDEAWAFACFIAQKMCMKAVSIRYGI